MSILRGQLKLVLQSLWQPVGWPSAQVEDLSVHPSICLSTYLPFYLSVSLSINHLSVYLFISVIYLWDKLSTCAPTELAPCSVCLKRSQQEWQMRSVCPPILKKLCFKNNLKAKFEFGIFGPWKFRGEMSFSSLSLLITHYHTLVSSWNKEAYFGL